METPREFLSMPTASRKAAARPETESNGVETDASDSPEADPVAVKQALRALIAGTAPSVDSDGVSTTESPVLSTAPATENPRPSPTTTVDRAHEALENVESTSAFVSGGGLERLRSAVSAAERAGDRATARTGQRTLASIERYRRAAAAGDHFHPGHGTVFRSGGEVETE